MLALCNVEFRKVCQPNPCGRELKRTAHHILGKGTPTNLIPQTYAYTYRSPSVLLALVSKPMLDINDGVLVVDAQGMVEGGAMIVTSLVIGYSAVIRLPSVVLNEV